MARERSITRTPERQIDGYDPWSSFRDMERVFRDIMSPVGRWGMMPSMENRPLVDLRETENELILSAQVPGMTKEDIDIDVTSDSISIRGERKTEEDKPGEKYHIRQQSYGSFSASYSLPMDVKADQVKASYKDGILEVIMPKSETAQTQKVKVE